MANSPEKRIVGIDISKDTFDACYVQGEKRVSEVFLNTEAGFRKLIKWASARQIRPVFCMEATGNYSAELADFLHGKGFEVFVQNPRFIKAYRESECMRTITDKQSAYAIALYATDKLGRMSKWQPLSPHMRRLRTLTRLREALLSTRTQWSNRDHSKSFAETPAAVALMIDQCTKAIREVEKQLKELVKSTPELRRDIKLLEGIEAIGFLTACYILAESTWLPYMRHKRDLVAFAGLNPAIRKSGTSVDYAPHLSKHGNARLRRALYMPAVTALRHNKRIKAFAERLRTKGKHELSILGAVMAKLLCFAFGVIRSGEPYRVELDPSPKKRAKKAA